MTQEDKQLLLQDLCARLPYGVIVAYKSRESEGRVSLGYGNIGYVAELGRGWWTDCKPYLRPMSSMTDEELKEFTSIHENVFVVGKNIYTAILDIDSINWLLEHYFDFMGLISKGLAIEVTKENNPYKI